MSNGLLDEFRRELLYSRDELVALQRAKLTRLLEVVRRENTFYAEKLRTVKFDPDRDPLSQLPLTTRADLQADQLAHPPFGSNLTRPLASYTRFHQTSGTNGQPLRWLDTPENWKWWKKCWMGIFDSAGIGGEDRVFFPFSFGPFVGFWSAFAGAETLGCLCIPGGGMTTQARIETMLANSATVVCCTPTYALRLADCARAEAVDLKSSAVRAVIVAGEPGGNIDATRQRIEREWGARVFDHAGMTEIGPWGFEHADCPRGLHILENEFIPEVIDPGTGRLLPEGSAGELVLTNLGRIDSPLIRYRTGDQVTLAASAIVGTSFRQAVGGVQGRVDDMLFIRGNNVFPSAIENILRGLVDLQEYRLQVISSGNLSDLRIDIEPCEGADAGKLSENVERAIRDCLHFRPIVCIVASGALPRYEMKARRVLPDAEQV
ncbi:MAG: phenylacetate--CoA ligase family protein [Phycisphaerae bacterium]